MLYWKKRRLIVMKKNIQKDKLNIKQMKSKNKIVTHQNSMRMQNK